jgi:molecular chaperone DnaK (HSP70)
MTAVGIDFGTTNSVIAVYGGGTVDVLRIDHPPSGEWDIAGFANVFPSAFASTHDGDWLFGWKAKEEGRHVQSAVKRLFATTDEVTIGGNTFFTEEIAAAIFGRMKSGALESGVDVSRAVVTVPANSRGLARKRTKICAGMAGIEVAALINEPTAAAMAFGLSAADDQRLLVIDWGGGTVDVALLEMANGIFIEQSSKGIQRLGGVDFDREIKHRLTADIPDRERWTETENRRLDLDVELAKIALTKADTTTVALPGGERRELTRKKLEEWLLPLIQRVSEPIDTCLRDTGMTTSSIDHVLLVGGTCAMPGVRDFVANHLRREPSRGPMPLTAIAEGAAVAAAILSGEHDSDFFVSTEHALGTISLGGRGPQFSKIIDRNYKLPARGTDVFVPIRDFQESVRITVIEGDPEKPLDHEDNVTLTEWELVLAPKPVDETSLEITYEYDVDGILHVSVVETQSGNQLLSDDVSFADRHEPRALVRMGQRVEDILSATRQTTDVTPLPNEVRAIVDRARRKVIPFVPDEEALRIGDLVRELEEAAAAEGDCEDEKEALEWTLRKYAYLY